MMSGQGQDRRAALWKAWRHKWTGHATPNLWQKAVRRRKVPSLVGRNDAGGA